MISRNRGLVAIGFAQHGLGNVALAADDHRRIPLLIRSTFAVPDKVKSDADGAAIAKRSNLTFGR
jgi:hypothetical protein